MFSVNNFYDFFSSHYGWDRTNIMPWSFQVHGSKNLIDLTAFFDCDRLCKNRYYWNKYGSIILHDQETFIVSMLDIYKTSLLQQNKSLMWQHMTNEELMLLSTYSCSWPIFCHSEENSNDIQWIKDIGMIDCHYFWHGLIARDWFRHWKHHANLSIQHNWNKRFLMYARDQTGLRTYRKTVVDALTPMRDQIEYNFDGENIADSSYSAKIIVNDAIKTAIHIVPETIFNLGKIHLTEKIFKPIVMRQPFVLFGGAGSLAYLRRYGFETFESVWDESYDLEVDHDIRLNKVTKLITDLYNKSSDEFANLITQCQRIVDHNRVHFYSQKFEDILLNELHTNVRNSIEIQQQRMIEDPGGAYFHVMNSMNQRKIELFPEMQIVLKETTMSIKNQQPLRFENICKKYSWIQDLM